VTRPVLWFAVAALTLAAAVVPLIRPGYDTAYALAWGRDLAGGLPLDFSHPSSPTPHPLTTAAAWVLGHAPQLAATATAVGTALSAAVLIGALGVLAYDLTRRRLPVIVTVICTLGSAPLGLLVLGAGIDVGYSAVAVVGVLATVRGLYGRAVAALVVAALLRPEAGALAIVPVLLSWQNGRAGSGRPRSIRATVTWCVGGAAVAAAWLLTGATGGQPMVALNSATTNADLNDNPQGLAVALMTLLPDLASVTGPVTLLGAAWACVAAWRVHRRRPGGDRALASDRVLHVALFVAAGAGMYLVQGLLGTPLVARYLLLPGLLCVPLAAGAITDLTGPSQPRRVLAAVTAGALIAGTLISCAPGWRDLVEARASRAETFANLEQLLEHPVARHCGTPLSVRSPALVPVVALRLEIPLSRIAVSGEAGGGALVQPLTLDAAELAGFGPRTPLAEQGRFPSDASPRTSNAEWALYSNCRP
jgi:hypothetical protein